MTTNSLHRRLKRLDGGRDLRHAREVAMLTDAQLQVAIQRELHRSDPVLAARYAAASADERAVIEKQIVAQQNRQPETNLIENGENNASGSSCRSQMPGILPWASSSS